MSYRYALKYEVDNENYKSELFGNEFSIYKKTKTKFRKKEKLELVCRVYLCCFENGEQTLKDICAGYYIKPTTDIESLVELAYILSADEQMIKEIQEKQEVKENG